MYHYHQRAGKISEQQESQQKKENYTKDILTTIVPIWRNYADETGSSLFVEDFEGEVDLMLTNSKEFSVREENTAIKLALGLATYIEIDMAENELQLCVSYSMEYSQ